MIIAISNQKGGVCKTTTAAVLSAGLTKRGYKCLAIDMDAQQTLGVFMGADTSRANILDVLTGEKEAREAIQKTALGDIIAGSDELEISGLREYGAHNLKDKLEPLKREYDFIIIDTPPGLGLTLVLPLIAAEAVIVPAGVDLANLQAVAKLAETIKFVKLTYNKNLKVAGVLLTKYNSRTLLSKKAREVLEQEAAAMESKIFNTTIREAVAIQESQYLQQNLFDYSPKAKVTRDYNAFIDELLKEL